MVELSYTESLKEFETHELENIFDVFVDIYPDSKEKFDIDKVCSTIENDFSSHTVKTLSSKNKTDGCQITSGNFLTSPGMEPKPANSCVIYPYMRYPTMTKFFKILLVPIKVGGVSKSLFDHIMQNDTNSDTIFNSFKKTFGDDNFERICKSVDVLKSKKEFEIYEIKRGGGFSNIPIVFVPYNGEYIQVTPITPTYNYSNVYRHNKSNNDLFVKREYLSLSSKLRNIDPIIGPTYTQKLFSDFPNMMNSYDAEIFKIVKNGGFPKFKPQSYKEFSSKLEGIGDFYKILEKINSSDVKSGMTRLIKSVVSEVVTWYMETIRYIKEEYPDYVEEPLDIFSVLVHYTNRNEDHNMIVKRIEEDGKLEKAIKEMGL